MSGTGRILVSVVLVWMVAACEDRSSTSVATPPEDEWVEDYEATVSSAGPSPAEIPRDVKRTLSVVLDEPTPRWALPNGVKGSNVAIRGNIPYFPYWQSEDKRFRFHAMAYGGFLSRIEPADAPPYLDQLEQVGVRVASGSGLLWFYPDNYNVNRMINRFVPSAISQGQIIGGLLDLQEKGSERAGELAEKAFEGLAAPYSQGGVNLAGRALLEIPLYDAPPEIILNGWLHALVFLERYAARSGDVDAVRLLNRNLEYMASSIADFHVERTGLSRYSNLTPYRIKLVSDNPQGAQYSAFYRSVREDLNDIAVELEYATDGERSPYENHIYARRGGNVENAWISVAQGYRSFIVSPEPFELSVAPGVYDPTTATPRSSGDYVTLKSKRAGEYSYVCLCESGEELFAGYPTNFAKGGDSNYYHVYHVVALAYFVATVEMPDQTRSVLQSYMRKWKTTVDEYEPPKGMRFASWEAVYSGLSQYVNSLDGRSWKELWQQANAR